MIIFLVAIFAFPLVLLVLLLLVLILFPFRMFQRVRYIQSIIAPVIFMMRAPVELVSIFKHAIAKSLGYLPGRNVHTQFCKSI